MSQGWDSVVGNLWEVFGSNSELGVVWGGVVMVISNDPQILLWESESRHGQKV